MGERQMADNFKPITSQEEFDAIISDRLARERSTTEKRFDGWTSPDKLAELKSGYEKQLEELKASHQSELETLGSKHAGELKTLQDTLTEKEKALAENEHYRTDLEKTRIALAAGLPERYASRLVGANADEWKADANELAKDFGASSRPASPLGGTDGAPKTTDFASVEANAYSGMLASLTGE